MIKTIGGVHVRLTKEQAAALAEIHKFSGIPTYFVVNQRQNFSSAQFVQV